jgi:hypothetical protein
MTALKLETNDSAMISLPHKKTGPKGAGFIFDPIFGLGDDVAENHRVSASQVYAHISGSV